MFSSPRIISVGLAIVLAGVFWYWINQERSNLLYLTRSLIGQVRKGGGDIEAPFVERMRFPEGPRDEQQQQVFDRLFTAMRQDVPRTVTYGEEGTYQHAGFRCPSREVRVECESGTRYTVRWARFRGNWYIVDCYDSAAGPQREGRASLLPAAYMRT